MPRRLAVIALVLFAMLWQSVALARLGSTVNALADTGHAALHWHEEGHHHHDDGSVHLDDSAESAQHVLGDQLGTSVALMAGTGQVFVPLGSAPPGGLQASPVPGPTLEGLLRPPRSRA